jgi:U4/U6.U5 tri-snRNP-associated protein 2
MATDTESGPPPAKRARLDESVNAKEHPTRSERKVDSSAVDDAESDEENEEEEVMKDLGEDTRPSDLYLDTVSIVHLRLHVLFNLIEGLQINRMALDFDFEKLCSVSLSNIHVYACLVCGKYFQGRGKSSYAYAHSVHDDHHVFMNLESSKVRELLTSASFQSFN